MVRNKSKFQPEKGRNKILDRYFDNLWNSNFTEKPNIPNNLSYRQRKSLQEIIDNDKIIIKEADKGSAVVVMDTEYYRNKIQEMLNDQNNYKQIDENNDTNIISKIKTLCQRYDNILTKHEIEYLTKFDVKTSNYYGLPKIHKSKLIKEAICEQNSEYIEILNPDDLKFRPIIAGPACPTHRLSNLVDILLQPFVNHVSSYVRDDIDYLNHIPSSATKDTLLTTFDVTSLYSNIPHDLGKDAIKFWLETYPNDLHQSFNCQFVIESIDLILNNNTFQFDNTHFIQVLGTAMGTKMAPMYATLTLGYLEKTLYRAVDNAFDQIDLDTFEILWKRYLDDCIIFWDESWGDINELHNILQNLHPNIKFTMECSKNELPFLDILLKIEGNKIITDIYRKPTDTQQYLHFRSQHPKACLKSIPYNLARRICTIISDPRLRDIRLTELSQALKQRSFPITLINKGIDLAKSIPLTELRRKKVKQNDEIIPFVTTFNRKKS